MERTLERLNNVAKRAEELGAETERLRAETASQIKHATREFRILFGVMVAMLIGIALIGYESYQQAQSNYEVLQIVEELQNTRGENLQRAFTELDEKFDEHTDLMLSEIERMIAEQEQSR